MLTTHSGQYHIDDAHSQRRAALVAALHAIGGWLQRWLPLIISLSLIAAIMDGVNGNITAQWLLALILCPALAAWVTNHARRWS
ncbi:hypothetical protein [Thiothrix winogradskyi]|uniref:Uncharacterized protein n=1 Tax=Thiothrix winogradskyi TaxID=96472 RepID=A0ABY3T4T6_9GAMM|nr:hypothetical protein [Thiothrix winogradskyi]UJS26249.1 hypothetical protein L2Y54_09480 [Thiothrix winogradskyi]